MRAVVVLGTEKAVPARPRRPYTSTLHAYFMLAYAVYVQRGGPTEGSTEAQQQAFYANRDFWSHEELQRLHHALRTPGQGT